MYRDDEATYMSKKMLELLSTLFSEHCVDCLLCYITYVAACPEDPLWIFNLSLFKKSSIRIFRLATTETR